MNWLSYLTNKFLPRKEGNVWFYPLYGPNVFEEIQYLDAFNSIPEVNAVISIKARAFANGVIKTVNDKGEQVPNAFTDKVLMKPNWFQTEDEFKRQTKLFREIFGNEYIYTYSPIGTEKILPIERQIKGIFTLPPNLVKHAYLEDQPFFMFDKAPENIKYSFVWDGQEITLNNKQLLHLNDNRVTILKGNAKNILTGESKMKGLAAPINNLRLAYESRGIMLKYRGSQGILSNANKDGVGSSIPIDKKEKDNIQEAYRQYGTLHSQSQIIITDAALTYTPMTIDSKKLMLFEETKECFFKICDSYGVPDDLFAQVKGATFENQRQAEARLYGNTIIPEANEWIKSLNEQYLPDSKDKMIMDFMHLPVFQEATKLKAERLEKTVNALSKAFVDGAIKINEYTEELRKLGIGQAA